MRLLILRHAKSGRPAGVEDFDRPLCERGMRAAPVIGDWIREQSFEPAFVLCSPARRTRQTLELVLPKLRGKPEIRYERALYLPQTSAVLEQLRAAPALSPLMVVGHNPSLHELSLALLAHHQRGEARKQADELSEKFPTAGLAVLEFSIRDWKRLKTTSGVLTCFVRPKSLLAAQGKA